MAENGGTVRSEPVLGNGQPIAREDLFPHLESLVAAELGTFGVIAEAFRLLSQHFKRFRLPILVVTVQTILGIVFHRLGRPRDRAWGLSIPSSMLRTTTQHAQTSYSSSGDDWLWFALSGVVVSLLLSGLAEAAFDQAAVCAYLQESHGPGQAAGGTSALLRGACRAIATEVAALVTTVGLALAAAVAGVLVLVLLNLALPAYDASTTVAVAGGVALFAIVGIYLTVVLIVAVPAAVVTKEWGFKALRRSFHLSVGNRVVAFKLLLLGFVVSNVLEVAAFFGGFIAEIVVAGVPGLIVNLGWFLVRIVLYLKFRASHKIAVNRVGA